MIRVGKQRKNRREIVLKLGMPLLREKDVTEPGVLEQHHSPALRRPRLRQDRTLTHMQSARARHQCRASLSATDDICTQGYL